MTEDSLHSPPRIVLFGRAGAGKSSLLGALALAAKTQGERLGAEVVDPEASLEPLLQRLTTNVAPETSTTSVIPHRLRLRPWHRGAKEPGEPGPITIIDSAGLVAEAILKSPELQGDPSRSELSRAIEEADALVLAISAGADTAELSESFQEFQAFLVSLGSSREWSRRVGGWQVSIVLTQCDRLAQPGDTRQAWLQRIEERKAFVRDRFAEFLKITDEASPHLRFGSLRVRVFASAVRWPRLIENDVDNEAPFGVADLFRESLAAAREHHERHDRSQQRLGWTIRAATVIIAVSIAMLTGLLARHPEDGVAQLEDEIRSFQHREGDTSTRLAFRNLGRQRLALEHFQEDAAFEFLSEDLRGYVRQRLQELQDYGAFRTALLGGLAPLEARSLEDLHAIEERIEKSLPAVNDAAWGDTEAGRLRAKWRADASTIRDAVGAWEIWYRDLIRQAGVLEASARFDGDWRQSVDRFLKRSGSLPFTLLDPLPNSVELPLSRGEAVTYGVPFEYDRVYQARQDWVFTRDRLLDLRDLADALGLTAGLDRKPAVLDLPEAETTVMPGERLRQLSQFYPSVSPTYSQWSLMRFPEPGQSELSRRLDRSLDRGLAHVRARILADLGPMPRAKDNVEGWRQVAARLDDTAFRDWGKLLTLLARLRNANAEDPVAELAVFLRASSFKLRLDSLELTVPDDLLTLRAMPKGDLTILHKPQAEAARVYRFSPVGDGERGRGETRFRFLGEGVRVLEFRPGDGLSATVTLRGGLEELNLTWSESRCETYAFEALSRPVRGVRLAPGPGTTIPSVSALLPDLRDLR